MLKFYSLKIKLERFWYEHVQCRIFPKQKWLTKLVPRTFCDVDTLIEDIVFACLVNFWENDNGEPSFRFQYEMYDDPEEYVGLTAEEAAKIRATNKALYDEVSEAYAWAKVREHIRKKTEEMLVAAYKTDKWSEVSKFYNEEEAAFIENDTRYLTTIIKYRQYLWT